MAIADALSIQLCTLRAIGEVDHVLVRLANALDVMPCPRCSLGGG